MVKRRFPANRDERIPGSASAKGGALSAPDLRNDVNFAVRADCREPGVLEDLAVDGDGDAFLQVRCELRIACAKLGKKLTHIADVENELALPAAELLEIPVQDYSSHSSIPLRPPSDYAMPRSPPTL